MGKESRGAEIFCPSCGKETLAVRKPVFKGLRKVGEYLQCIECGHIFEDENELEFVERKEVKIFDEKEEIRLCKHCVHYVKHPLKQRCMLFKKEIEPTDCCNQFRRRDEDSEKMEREGV